MTAIMAVVLPTSQGRLLRRISIANRPRPFRVVVLGQEGVGKSALTVRFLTRRFIGDYDPHLEKVYTCTRGVDGDTVVFEVLDTAAPQQQGDTTTNTKTPQSLEDSIRWADAYILLYSVADRCSLNECLRLKFLINAYGKRSRKLSLAASPEAALSINPVALVGNQNDRSLDRMVPLQEGVSCAAQLGCVAFYEISVRECCDSVHTIFEDLYTCHKRPKKFRAVYPRRSVSECKFGSGEGDGVATTAEIVGATPSIAEGGGGLGGEERGWEGKRLVGVEVRRGEEGERRKGRRRRSGEGGGGSGENDNDEEEGGEGMVVVAGMGGGGGGVGQEVSRTKEVESMTPSRRRGALQCIS